MSQPSTASRPKTPHKKPTPQPIWWRLVFLGVMAVVLQLGLTAMPTDTAVGKLGRWAETNAGYFWLAAGACVVLGLLVRVFSAGTRSNEGDIDNGEVHSTDDAARVAIAFELQHRLRPSQVRLRVRHVLRPRLHRQPKLRLYRPARRVTIHLPKGLIHDNPGAALAMRLTPLLGQLRKHTWEPRKGRCVLISGAPQGWHDDKVPEAATDPRERVLQVLEPVVGENISATVTETDDQGAAKSIDVHHPTNFRLHPDNALPLQQRVDERMPTLGNQGWGVEIHPERDTIRVFQRPAMPDKIPHRIIDYTATFAAHPELYGPEPRVLPCATDEKNRICGWNISRKTQKPHALLVGPTGGGKTNAITTMVVGAARQGSINNEIDIWGLDPKMIELMALQDFPGVTQLAFRIQNMAATIDAAYDEMMYRYNLIAGRQIHPDDLPPLVLILDEYLILVSMLTYWWKVEQKGKGPCPQLNKLTQMLALSRSSAIYILLGVQRPDASLFTEGARDNLRFRGALGQLSPQGAEMMWNNRAIGTRPLNTVGRGVITGPDGWPIEAQYWYTPNMDTHPMYRDRLSSEDRKLVEALTPPMYTPRSIIKEGIELPPSAEIPQMGGVEAEMGDVQEVVRARDLDVGDAIKVEDSSGRMSKAYVEAVDYDEGSREATLSIHWEGGSAEDIGLSGDEQVWYIGSDLPPNG